MDYKPPEVTTLKPAIDAVQDVTLSKELGSAEENCCYTLSVGCYEDNEL